MAFRTGSYGKVWEIKPATGNYTDIRFSTSKKRKDTGEYETDFSGFVRLIGDAHAKAGSLKEGDRIKIGDISATQTYNKEQQKTYTNFQMYSFEVADGQTQPQQTSATPTTDTGFVNVPDSIVEEELPFN